MQTGIHVTISTHLQPSRITIWLFDLRRQYYLGDLPRTYAVGVSVACLVYVQVSPEQSWVD